MQAVAARNVGCYYQKGLLYSSLQKAKQRDLKWKQVEMVPCLGDQGTQGTSFPFFLFSLLGFLFWTTPSSVKRWLLALCLLLAVVGETFVVLGSVTYKTSTLQLKEGIYDEKSLRILLLTLLSKAEEPILQPCWKLGIQAPIFSLVWSGSARTEGNQARKGAKKWTKGVRQLVKWTVHPWTIRLTVCLCVRRLATLLPQTSLTSSPS